MSIPTGLHPILRPQTQVQYKIGEDLDLGFHYDDSEVTLNVCLGKEWEGEYLNFLSSSSCRFLFFRWVAVFQRALA